MRGLEHRRKAVIPRPKPPVTPGLWRVHLHTDRDRGRTEVAAYRPGGEWRAFGTYRSDKQPDITAARRRAQRWCDRENEVMDRG